MRIDCASSTSFKSFVRVVRDTVVDNNNYGNNNVVFIKPFHYLPVSLAFICANPHLFFLTWNLDFMNILLTYLQHPIRCQLPLQNYASSLFYTNLQTTIKLKFFLYEGLVSLIIASISRLEFESKCAWKMKHFLNPLFLPGEQLLPELKLKFINSFNYLIVYRSTGDPKTPFLYF